jgi:AmmeMemoRadiSam system protein B/AmmeMemoRadiSam system protein A
VRTAPSIEPRVRRAAVAGTFYAAEPPALREQVRALLEAALAPGPVRPKALVVPHAGYVYSGPVAASAYAQLRAPGPRVERVVLVGPAHHVAHPGLALPDTSAFLTPLGAVPIDRAAAVRAARLHQVTVSGAAHLREHSLEVQLPFLQVVLGEFSLVPFTVGEASPEVVAEVLHLLWGGPETLVVCSTDLSHYLEAAEARVMDRRTADQVLALDAHGLRSAQACGRTPLAGLLLEARRRDLEVTLLDLRNSGDTAGGADRVVGYGAFALHPRRAGGARPAGAEARGADPAGDPGRTHRAAVATALARAAVGNLFGGPAPQRPAGEDWLDEPRGCFVSLHEGGELRGCIGSHQPRGTLFEELVSNARAAATRDPRFEPVTAAELGGVDFEVSVLSPLEPLFAEDEAEALRLIRPGRDGLLLQSEGRSATFIPAVWEQLPEPRDFLRHLRHKAGLPDAWTPGTRLYRFGAERYREPG